jgi:hypothetical protein
MWYDWDRNGTALFLWFPGHFHGPVYPDHHQFPVEPELLPGPVLRDNGGTIVPVQVAVLPPFGVAVKQFTRRLRLPLNAGPPREGDRS